MKPKQSKIEFDMAMDVDSENYDGEVEEHLRLRKQVSDSYHVPHPFFIDILVVHGIMVLVA